MRVYHIPAEMTQAEDKRVCSEIHIFIHCILNKEELPQWWKESVTYLWKGW